MQWVKLLFAIVKLDELFKDWVLLWPEEYRDEGRRPRSRD